MNMSTIEKSVDVNVPVAVAYNQWTQFESFPQFMGDVQRVVQKNDKTMYWHVSIDGHHLEFEVEVTEQIPDKRIAWRSLDGRTHAGVITFHHLSAGRTRIMLQLSYHPEGIVEKVGDLLGVMDRHTSRDLVAFKRFIEGRGSETGAWRGAVRRTEDRPSAV